MASKVGLRPAVAVFSNEFVENLLLFYLQMLLEFDG